MSSRQPYCPDAFDIIWIDFDPQAGHEQAGRRPAFVLSPRSYNSPSGLCLLCPMTNQIKGYPFEVAMPPGHRVSGVILADQIKSMSWKARRATYLSSCEDVAGAVVANVMALLPTLA